MLSNNFVNNAVAATAAAAASYVLPIRLPNSAELLLNLFPTIAVVQAAPNSFPFV